jgi:hypothetical protein
VCFTTVVSSGPASPLSFFQLAWTREAREFCEIDTLVRPFFDREREQQRYVPGDMDMFQDDDDGPAQGRASLDTTSEAVRAREAGSGFAQPVIVTVAGRIAQQLDEERYATPSSKAAIALRAAVRLAPGLRHQAALDETLLRRLATTADGEWEAWEVVAVGSFVRHMAMIARFQHALLLGDDVAIEQMRQLLGDSPAAYVERVVRALRSRECRLGFLRHLQRLLGPLLANPADQQHPTFRALCILEAYDDYSADRLFQDMATGRALPSCLNRDHVVWHFAHILPPETRVTWHRFALDVLLTNRRDHRPVTEAEAVAAHLVVLDDWTLCELLFGQWTVRPM